MKLILQTTPPPANATLPFTKFSDTHSINCRMPFDLKMQLNIQLCNYKNKINQNMNVSKCKIDKNDLILCFRVTPDDPRKLLPLLVVLGGT